MIIFSKNTEQKIVFKENSLSCINFEFLTIHFSPQWLILVGLTLSDFHHLRENSHAICQKLKDKGCPKSPFKSPTAPINTTSKMLNFRNSVR